MWDAADAGTLGALWLTVAMLAGGFARSRGRTALGWFFLTAIFGPFAAFFLVTLPARPVRGARATSDS